MRKQGRHSCGRHDCQEQIDEILVLTSQLLKPNVVSIKELRSLTGKMQSIAAWLHIGAHLFVCFGPHRLQLDILTLPPGDIWSSQIAEPTWFKAVSYSWNGTVVRTFNLNTHLSRG
jgi:hypothetical protein